MKMQPSRDAARHILALRHLGEGDTDFAKRIGISKQQLSNLKGGSGAGLETVWKVAKATGISADGLLGLRPGDKPPDAAAEALEDMAKELHRRAEAMRRGPDSE